MKLTYKAQTKHNGLMSNLPHASTSLQDLPVELLHSIFIECDQSSTYALLLTNSFISKVALRALFRFPALCDSRALLEFASAVDKRPNLATLVRHLVFVEDGSSRLAFEALHERLSAVLPGTSRSSYFYFPKCTILSYDAKSRRQGAHGTRWSLSLTEILNSFGRFLPNLRCLCTRQLTNIGDLHFKHLVSLDTLHLESCLVPASALQHLWRTDAFTLHQLAFDSFADLEAYKSLAEMTHIGGPALECLTLLVPDADLPDLHLPLIFPNLIVLDISLLGDNFDFPHSFAHLVYLTIRFDNLQVPEQRVKALKRILSGVQEKRFPQLRLLKLVLNGGRAGLLTASEIVTACAEQDIMVVHDLNLALLLKMVRGRLRPRASTVVLFPLLTWLPAAAAFVVGHAPPGTQVPGLDAGLRHLEATFCLKFFAPAGLALQCHRTKIVLKRAARSPVDIVDQCQARWRGRGPRPAIFVTNRLLVLEAHCPPDGVHQSRVSLEQSCSSIVETLDISRPGRTVEGRSTFLRRIAIDTPWRSRSGSLFCPPNPPMQPMARPSTSSTPMPSPRRRQQGKRLRRRHRRRMRGSD